MKTINLLLTFIIMMVSLSSFADEKPLKVKKGIHTEKTVVGMPAIPMITADPDENAPDELKNLLAYPSVVPAAPFVTGDPNEEAPAELKNLLAYPVKIPAAPMVLGNPDEEAPDELKYMAAYAINRP